MIIKNFTGYGLTYESDPNIKPGMIVKGIQTMRNTFPTFRDVLDEFRFNAMLDLRNGRTPKGPNVIYELHADELDIDGNPSTFMCLNRPTTIHVGDIVWRHTPEFFSRPVLPVVAAVRAKQLAEKQRINRLLNASLRYHDKTI